MWLSNVDDRERERGGAQRSVNDTRVVVARDEHQAGGRVHDLVVGARRQRPVQSDRMDLVAARVHGRVLLFIDLPDVAVPGTTSLNPVNQVFIEETVSKDVCGRSDR